MKRLSCILVLSLILTAQPVQASPFDIAFYGVLYGGAEVTGSFAYDGSSAIFYLPGEPLIVWPGCDLCIYGPPSMGDGYWSYEFASWHFDPLGYKFGHSMELSFGAPDWFTGVMPLTRGIWNNYYSGTLAIFSSGFAAPYGWSPEPEPEPAVPEPASLLLVGTGLVGLRAWRKRRR